ncbi:MAG: fibronectin type III domain-containing protein [candidate division WOR-3 bacterium]|nr:MAG: fibronectin type III domain-containing protein [candidate division WOR-3 bacterium]
MVHMILAVGLMMYAPTGVQGYDTPNDEGQSITITWQPSPGDSGHLGFFQGYEVYRFEKTTGEYNNIGFVSPGTTSFQDNTGVDDGKEYYYFIRSLTAAGSFDSEITGPFVARAQWFNTQRLNVLVVMLLVSILVIYYIRRARAGDRLFIRKIPGLDAIDDAVGRSTEMGKPIIYSIGLGYLNEVWTIASLSILSRVAKKCAEYSTRLLVPHCDPLVMSAAQETVKEAYSEAGRPDLYDERDIPFLTADQFGYAAGVDGMMVREEPGAAFWQGYFFAESLILAETGHSVGAIQIAGTPAIDQLPFFIAACDYTLIGEEMYAASCYLNPEPQMLGSLKGEDFSKAVILIFLVAAVTLGTVGVFLQQLSNINGVGDFFEQLVQWFNTF